MIPSDSEHARDGDTPRFITSSPPGDDLLEGKSQEKIAESISALMRDCRMEHRLVGLDGDWGSGKSNLVKIVERKLQSGFHFFTYDAWGHQEDLQRRTFLEELTEDLCKTGLIDRNVWERKLEDLLARRRKIESKTIPRLSAGLIITGILALLMPIAGSIGEVFDDPRLAVLTTAAPLLIGISVYLVSSLMAKRWLGVRDVYALYRDEELSNEVHETISESEPSVRQFQSWIGDLSAALHGKQLVVVFDNMDRLPSDRVRQLWSSIHTFFVEDSYKNLWIIVPFDRGHLAAAFDNNVDVANQFLNKSFSVIYRVAPPVLTDWQKFFEEKYQQAFGQREEEELHIVRRTFDVLQQQITPRDIIAFINELVSIRLAVEERIKLRYIALFVLAKREILEDPVDQILSLKFLRGAAPLFRDDNDVANYVAALVYQVPLASASQVSLSREIQNSLRDNNPKRLRELAEHRHFLEILENVIGDTDIDVGNASSALASLVSDGDASDADQEAQRYRHIWDELCDKELGVPLAEQALTDTHELLFLNTSQPKRQRLAEHIVRSVRNAKEFSGARYYVALSGLKAFVDEHELGIDVDDLILDLRKSPDVFVEYVAEARERYGEFKLKCVEAQLLKYLEGRIPNELAELDALKFVIEEYDLKRLIPQIEQAIDSDSVTLNSLVEFYGFYKAIAIKKPIRPLGDPHLVNLLNQSEAGSAAQIELLAMRLARANQLPIQGVFQQLLTQTDETLVSSIAHTIEYYADYGTLIDRFLDWPHPLLQLVLRSLTLSPVGSSRLSITSALTNFSRIYEGLEISPDDLIRRLDAWHKFAKKEITAENVETIIVNWEFFEYATDASCALSKHAIAMMVERLGGLDVTDWQLSLRDENSYDFKVTSLLLRSGDIKKLPENAVFVYKDILTAIAKGEFSAEEASKWEIFYERINKNKLKATAKTIRDMFIASHDITAEKFIQLFRLLLNDAELTERSPDVARRILTPVASYDDCLELIVDNSDYFVSIIDAADDDAEDFKDIVRQKVIDPEVNADLVEFARRIGVNVAGVSEDVRDNS